MNAGKVPIREGTGYRPDVDGLRAVAVAGVVLCHADLGLPGGYVGVDVFFVISGYLIVGLLMRAAEADALSLRSFWVRRVRRIVPALVVVTAATLFAGWFLLMPTEYAALGRSASALSVGLSNVHFCRSVNYFAPAAGDEPLVHTWSLAVEEQFYLLIPLIVAAAGRRLGRRPLFALFAVAAAASLGLSVYGIRSDPVATFYLLPTRAWELLAGALLACAPAPGLRPRPLVLNAAALVGLALIVIPFVAYDRHTAFPGLTAVPPVLGSVLLIRSGSGPGRLPAISRALGTPLPVSVGLISYSLYLWHWPVLVFLRRVSAVEPTVLARLAAVAGAVLAATLSWRLVEQPFRRGRTRPSARRVVTVAATAFAAILLAGAWLSTTAGYPARLPAGARAVATTGRYDWRLYAHDAGDVPDRLARLGTEQTRPELLVWGDSHAMTVLPAVDAACRDAGVTGLAAAHVATAPLIGFHQVVPYGLYERAGAFNNAVLEYVRVARIRKVILVANWYVYASAPDFASALLRTMDALTAAGAEPYLMSPVPSYRYDVPRKLFTVVLLGRNTSDLGMPLREYGQATESLAALFPELLRRHVGILDPVPVFQQRTGADDLVPFDEGGCFYSDNQHLSTYGAMALKPLFAQVLAEYIQRARAPAAPDEGIMDPRTRVRVGDG